MNPVLKPIAVVSAILVAGCTNSSDTSGGNRGGILGNIVNTSFGEPIEEEMPALDDVASIDSLIGEVQFRYRFDLVAEDYIDTFTFSQENKVNIEGQERLYKQTSQKSYICDVITASRYLCLIVSSNSQVAESFLFSLGSNGQGSGNYEYCTWEEAQTGDCGSEVVENPDGTVDVTVNATIAARSTLRPDSMLISTDTYDHKLVSEQADAPTGSVMPRLASDQALIKDVTTIMRSVTAAPQ